MNDGWPNCEVHCLCYFACYIFNKEPKSRLISLALMMNKESNETTEIK